MNKKIAVITYFNDAYSELGKITTSVMFSYCQHHGYDFICGRDENAAKGRSPLWSKIPLLTNNLSNYDWVVWIDSDAMPVNFSHKLEDFIDEDYNMVLAHEHHMNPTRTCINTGVMFMKNCLDNLELLAGSWAQEECCGHPWEDQFSVMEYLRKNPEMDEKIKKIEVKPINVKPENFEETDFIMHIMGGPANPQHKTNVAKQFLGKIGFYGK